MKPPSPKLGRMERISLAIGMGFALSVWLVSLWLQPDPRGHNTHTQLGLPPCPKLARTGWPCLTCGMTTAFALAARGRFDQALVCQPLGTVLFVGVMAGGMVAFRSWRRQQSLVPVLRRWFPWRFLGLSYLLLFMAVASWAYKARVPIQYWLHSPEAHSSIHPQIQP